MTARIRQAVLDEMIAHARETRPNECCGLLIGRADQIESCRRATNILANPTRYQIDPADHFAAIRSARSAGLEVVGGYHSHPHSKALPSPSDRELAWGPDFLYVIVSLAGPSPPFDIRGFRLIDGNFVEISLVPLP